MEHFSRRLLVLACSTMAITCGCTTSQLRRTTISQSETIHDIYQQQVLDNLAMFVHNRNSYPYFALIGQGTTTLTDTGMLADTNGWARNATNHLLFTSAGLNPSLTRAQMASWQTYAVNDSVKLNVMQCIYRVAVDSCLGPASDHSCPDCANLFYAYYNMQPPMGSQSIPYLGGPLNDPADPSNVSVISVPLGPKSTKQSAQIVTDLPYGQLDQFKGYLIQIGTGATAESTVVASSVPSAGTAAPNQTTTFLLPNALVYGHAQDTSFTLSLSKRLPIRGIVTPECLNFRSAWFCCGSKLPKYCDKCTPQGCYCGTHVWVPEEGIDQLTKLTLLIQDVAYYDPPPSGTAAITTQKTTNAPGGTHPASRTLRETLSKMKAENRDTKTLESLAPVIEALESEIQASQTTTTTTTVIGPPRQPTQFQPGVLNLQQQLNMLPPR